MGASDAASKEGGCNLISPIIALTLIALLSDIITALYYTLRKVFRTKNVATVDRMIQEQTAEGKVGKFQALKQVNVQTNVASINGAIYVIQRTFILVVGVFSFTAPLISFTLGLVLYDLRTIDNQGTKLTEWDHCENLELIDTDMIHVATWSMVSFITYILIALIGHILAFNNSAAAYQIIINHTQP